jgi:sugar lactone lactonase YvrE
MRTVLTGLTFGESVRWHEGRVWFCDWVAGEVVASTPDGEREVMARVDTMPFCIDWLPSGELLLTGQPKLVRQRDGALETYADLSHITTKPWNEVAVDPRGNAYANSINFDFPGGEYQPGLIALVRPNGTVATVAGDIAFPNGMVVTPDGSTLIVAESYAARLTAFTIDPDGGLSDRRVWADLGEGAAPDGIGLDPDGNIWVADVPNRNCTLVREGAEAGEVLRRVDTPLGCFSCAYGDGTLYMVVADYSDPAKMFSSQTGLLLAEDIG